MTENVHDLGTLRGFSKATLELFNVRKNGTGWEYDTQTVDGKTATRWKSFSSVAPEGSENWKKYCWIPDKPNSAKYFYPPGLNLKKAIEENGSVLWIVGGEMALMSMIEAKILNSICFFGDQTIPNSLSEDLDNWNVFEVRVIPDRDISGEAMALKIHDLLKDKDFISEKFFALPYLLLNKHGKDVNDFWLENKDQSETFLKHLLTLSEWILPQPKLDLSRIEKSEFESRIDTEKLPEEFTDKILRDIESRVKKSNKWKSDGWSHNFNCPFHDDQIASADFNRESMSFKCFACGNKNAKDYGEQVGIYLRDYFDSTPTIKKEKPVTQEIKIIEPKTQRLSPPLPDFAQLNPIQKSVIPDGRKWLDQYIYWARENSPLTPDLFHEAIGIWLLSTVSTRRMRIRIGGEDIYPNLYILVVGKTTIYRKSTAMKLAWRILKDTNLTSLLLPSEATPEALFDELAGIRPVNFDSLSPEARLRWQYGRAVAAQRSFMKDEASSVFASMKKEYMAGLSEMLLQGYDGDSGNIDKRLKSKGIITIKDLCLSFLGATTPVMYSKHIGSEENENGFAARFAIITPNGNSPYRSPADEIKEPNEIQTQLKKMYMEILPWHGEKTPASIDPIEEIISPPVKDVTGESLALAQLHNYRRALGWDIPLSDSIGDSKSASYARLGTMAFKIAMLFAAIDSDSKQIRIQESHAYAAQELCERWRESLHRLDGQIARANYNGSDNKVLDFIEQGGALGVTIREIMQNCNIKTRNKAVEDLMVLSEDGRIEKYDYKPTGKGRPTVRYRLAGIDSE